MIKDNSNPNTNWGVAGNKQMSKLPLSNLVVLNLWKRAKILTYVYIDYLLLKRYWVLKKNLTVRTNYNLMFNSNDFFCSKFF